MGPAAFTLVTVFVGPAAFTLVTVFCGPSSLYPGHRFCGPNSLYPGAFNLPSVFVGAAAFSQFKKTFDENYSKVFTELCLCDNCAKSLPSETCRKEMLHFLKCFVNK
jgi:hypothetical protein